MFRSLQYSHLTHHIRAHTCDVYISLQVLEPQKAMDFCLKIVVKNNVYKENSAKRINIVRTGRFMEISTEEN